MFDVIGIKHCDMQAIDNWNYENLQHIKETNNFQIDLLVESEKIVIIDGSSNNGTCIKDKRTHHRHNPNFVIFLTVQK